MGAFLEVGKPGSVSARRSALARRRPNDHPSKRRDRHTSTETGSFKRL